MCNQSRSIFEVSLIATIHEIVSQICILLKIVLLNLICTKVLVQNYTSAAMRVVEVWSFQAFPTNSTSKMRVEFGGMRHDPVEHKNHSNRLLMQPPSKNWALFNRIFKSNFHDTSSMRRFEFRPLARLQSYQVCIQLPFHRNLE